MSNRTDEHDPAAETVNDAVAPTQLDELMAAGDKGTARPAAAATDHAATPSPSGNADLEARALRAAEAALAEGEKAIASATAQLREPPPKTRRGSRRELALRLLLAANVLAMVVVASLPSAAGPSGTATPSAEPAAPVRTAPVTPPAPPAPKLEDPMNRAMAAAEQRDYPEAIRILEAHLADSPRMVASQRLSALMALGWYAARMGNDTAAQDYQRRADAIEQSHKLPEDLVAEAQAAMASGDQASLRRIWARFLLQQRQIPGWLYKHVAEAYLQLGDSYRLEANDAAEKARLAELEAAAARLRAAGPEGSRPDGGKPEGGK